jgi:hypothetical protein
MVQVEFRIGGRIVEPSRCRDALERVTLQAILNSLRTRVGTLQCAEHRESVTILAKGPSVHSLSFELAGCCEAAIDEAKRRLA